MPQGGGGRRLTIRPNLTEAVPVSMVPVFRIEGDFVPVIWKKIINLRIHICQVKKGNLGKWQLGNTKSGSI